MRCLVTGANGFAASHLIDHLLEEGHEVTGTVRIRARLDNISHVLDKIKLVNMDLHDPFGVRHVVFNNRPEAVFHLAAQSFVGWSWSHPDETLKTNVNGTLYLLEALREFEDYSEQHITITPPIKIHIASSSQVYGKTDGEMGKDTLFNPMNPYDTSKLAQDMLALQYANSYGMHIVRTRAFNISGPRRGESFAESSWAKQVAELELKGGGEIKHGNLESYRDYIDVRDVVRCYARACFTGNSGDLYILGSGQPTKMEFILDTLLRRSTCKNIGKVVDPSRLRPSDTPYMKAKDSVMREWLGDITPFDKTLTDLLNYWRGRVR